MALSLGVRELAERLGISPTRVRQLVRQGELPAESVGGRWLFDAGVALESRPPGRPLAARNAWGLLLLAEGRVPTWLDRFECSRLRGRLRMQPSVEEASTWCRRRADVHRFVAHRSVLERLCAMPGAVVTGVRARGHDVVELGGAEVYLRPTALAKATRAFALEPVSHGGNVLVRVPPKGVWPFNGAEAGPATVAVDLWDAGDSRSRRAARALFEAVLGEGRYEPGWRHAV